jgi:methionine--tRNA ligase beta chain
VDTSEHEEEEEQYITFEEFSRVRLQIGKVIEAESIPGMKKILKVKVDIGVGKRELAVGAAPYYRPEELIDRVVVVCTNLEPRKIGGVISNGMLLAAEGVNGRPIFLTITEDATLGAIIH